MKPFSALALALCCTAPAAAAMSPSAQIKPWLGTWSCGKTTQTFTPIFNGTGMRISETGKMASEDIVLWDAKHRSGSTNPPMLPECIAHPRAHRTTARSPSIRFIPLPIRCSS